MPIVRAAGKVIQCETGANLRQVLLKAGVALYNGNATVINCRSIGTCGTCAVRIEGEPGAINEANWRDRTRRSLPPPRWRSRFTPSLSNPGVGGYCGD